jgi:hypothetical protein
MMKIGVNVGLGTDGANCGDTYSVFDQVLASLIHNIETLIPICGLDLKRLSGWEP